MTRIGNDEVVDAEERVRDQEGNASDAWTQLRQGPSLPLKTENEK